MQTTGSQTVQELIHVRVRAGATDTGTGMDRIPSSMDSVFQQLQLIRRLQYSQSNRQHANAHGAFGIVIASKHGSRCE